MQHLKKLYYSVLIMAYYPIPNKRLLSFYLFMKHKQGYTGSFQDLEENLREYDCLKEFFHITNARSVNFSQKK